MIDVLLAAKDAIAGAAGQSALAPDTLAGFQARYRQAALCGITANPHSSKREKPQARALSEPLPNHAEERYMIVFSIPFGNNQVERDLWMAKVQQRILGSGRTLTNAG